jgi:hypothetical protein
MIDPGNLLMALDYEKQMIEYSIFGKNLAGQSSKTHCIQQGEKTEGLQSAVARTPVILCHSDMKAYPRNCCFNISMST